ncbi:MAG: VOC family protein [Phycisphaerales bacterium]
MFVHAINPILNVADVPASVAWFERLGWHRGFTWNAGGGIDGSALHNVSGPATFASVGAHPGGGPAGPVVFLCKDGQGSRDPNTPASREHDRFGGVWMSWWVADVDAAHAECLALGVEIARPPADEPWGVREFLIRHPDGHCFRISGHTRR